MNRRNFLKAFAAVGIVPKVLIEAEPLSILEISNEVVDIQSDTWHDFFFEDIYSIADHTIPQRNHVMDAGGKVEIIKTDVERIIEITVPMDEGATPLLREAFESSRPYAYRFEIENTMYYIKGMLMGFEINVLPDEVILASLTIHLTEDAEITIKDQ